MRSTGSRGAQSFCPPAAAGVGPGARGLGTSAPSLLLPQSRVVAGGSRGGRPGCRSGMRPEPLAAAISCSLCDSRAGEGPAPEAGAEPRGRRGGAEGGAARAAGGPGPAEHPAPRRGAPPSPRAAPPDLPLTQVSGARRAWGRRGDRDAAGDGDVAGRMRERLAPLLPACGGRSARRPR